MRSNKHPEAKNAAAQSLIQRLLSGFCFAVLMFPGVAPGMEFRIYYQPQIKMKMVIGEGRIQEGDAKKF
ncbi:hypothetical protein AB4142_30745, partial [Variovorax sp. 2RAF20]